MGLRVNGHEYPWPVVIGTLTFAAWLGGLSIIVQASDERSKANSVASSEVAQRLARIETEARYTKESINEVKGETKETNVKLDRIIEKLSEASDD